MKREPLLTAGAIVGIAAALVALLVEFGLGLTEGQQSAILALVGVAAPFIVVLAARGKVTPDPAGTAGDDPEPQHRADV